MTYEGEVEAKRPSVGTKVLVFGCAILAVLGSFWGIVWFIRSYVEPPRVMLPAPITLAAGENRAAPAPAAPLPAETTPNTSLDAGPSSARAAPAMAAPVSIAQDAASGGLADRWAPLSTFAPAATVAPAPSEPAEAQATMSAPVALPAAGADNESAEEVAEGSVPAIAGRAPLPRRKPTQTASAAKRLDPPLPRPRPDGPAPQSVFTGVGTSDDRFQSGQ
jgi:hypothetical protein